MIVNCTIISLFYLPKVDFSGETPVSCAILGLRMPQPNDNADDALVAKRKMYREWYVRMNLFNAFREAENRGVPAEECVRQFESSMAEARARNWRITTGR